LALLASILVVAASRLPAGATDPDALCTGDPCVIDKTITVDPGSLIDFGNRTLRLTNHALISVGTPPPDRGPSVEIAAEAITLDPGARIISSGAVVTLTAYSGDVTLNSAVVNSRIDLSDSYGGGDIALYAAGNVVVHGILLGNGTAIDAYGGSIELRAEGQI